MKTNRHRTSSGTGWIRDRFVEAVYGHLGLRRLVVTRILGQLLEEPPDRVAAEVTAALEDAVAGHWDKGWQPADLAHAVSARLGRAPAELARLAITAHARDYTDLARRVAPRWIAQVDDLEAAYSDASYLWQVDGDPAGALGAAVELHGFLLQLPPLPLLTDPPSRWDQLGPSDADSLPSGVLAKVRALLAKAESTNFEAEAEAFTAKAQELMTRYRVDQAMVDRGPADRAAQPGARRITIDDPYADAKATLLSAVAQPNGCRAVWSKVFRHCTVFGFPAELDAVDELFTSLLVQAEHALIREGSKQDHLGRSRTKQFRRSFLVAFAHRIGQRLRATVDETIEEASAKTATALVPLLAAREEETEAAVTRTFPRLGTFSQSVTDAEGWQAGTTFADRANLTVSPRLPRS